MSSLHYSLGTRLHPFGDETPFAFIILNQAMCQETTIAVDRMWDEASMRVCADGGFDRIDVRLRGSVDAIVGDMDSLMGDTGNVLLAVDACQEQNDLQKSIKFIRNRNPFLRIIAIGALGGRFDHTAAAISSLFESNDLWLEGGNSWACRINKGNNQFKVQVGKPIGLIPFGGPACVTTQGLKWNLTDGKLQLGKHVSSSNEAACDEMLVQTDAAIVFTISQLELLL
jgi:thiamine pyrophosphokinase